MASKEPDFDIILKDLGGFGRYQIMNYCLIFVPIMFSAVYNAQYVFSAGAVDYRCTVPECESSPPEWDTGEWGSWALGAGRCERRRTLAPGGVCAPATFHENLTQACDAWLYGNQDTIVAEFDLACQEWKRTLVGTIHSAGLFAALPLTGYISDTFGRRTAFVLTAVSASVMGLIRSFSSSYSMYLVFEFLDATLGSGVYSTGFILALEMVGLNQRVLGGNMISSAFAIGQVLLALVAWAIPYWRTLTRVLYAPSLLFIFYYFIVEESVRWLLSKGKKKEAARIIYKAAAINRKELSPESIKQLSEDPTPTPNISIINGVTTSIPIDETPQRSLFSQVLRSRIIISRLFICSFWWITVTFIYYGLSINSVSLAGNSYVNYILTALVEIPGYALSVLTLDRFGRKSAIMTSFFVCGTALIALPFIPNVAVMKSLTMVSKLCISMTFASIYIYTIELFPTQGRSSLIGFCSMIGRIGSLSAPQTPLVVDGVHGVAAVPGVRRDGGLLRRAHAAHARDAAPATARHHPTGGSDGGRPAHAQANRHYRGLA
ncbi:organic cation transporter protein-like isoform X3 [Choristoneura fumiferana]|uniref:organic cation transporter protein-like isoform X3 n=1 Tax=Choristoneura fumiferana TaxID=7141 RepID=UPI003D1544A4